MFELVFLGTAAAVPSAEPASPVLLIARGPVRFLVDGGEGKTCFRRHRPERQIRAEGL